MADDFLKLSAESRRAILVGAETQTGIKPYLLEKDIWICWVLSLLFSLPSKMAFKGGTSLSKRYGLIDRFSEDVDVTIDYREFMPDLDLSNESKSSLKKKRDELKLRLNDYVENKVIPLFNQAFASEFNNEDLSLEFKDGEKLYIYYPSVFANHSEGYVKHNVLVEFGGTNITEPSEIRLVKPYLNVDALNVPSASVPVLSPARTFWEKVTLIHVECHRGRLVDAPDRLSRHWYDLTRLSESWVKSSALQNKSLLMDVLKVKKAFFNSGYANYDKCENKNFCLIPNDGEISQLRLDYTKMINSGMFLSEPEPFHKLLLKLQKLQLEIKQI